MLPRLRRPWGDGTRAIRFEPIELLEKLASMVPKPRVNLLLYHGVFAPHARNRPGAVRSAPQGTRPRHTALGACTVPNGATTPGATATDEPQRSARAAPPSLAGEARQGADAHATSTARPPPLGSYTRPKHYAWAKLLERTFEIAVLVCPDCGGRLRFAHFLLAQKLGDGGRVALENGIVLVRRLVVAGEERLGVGAEDGERMRVNTTYLAVG